MLIQNPARIGLNLEYKKKKNEADILKFSVISKFSIEDEAKFM